MVDGEGEREERRRRLRAALDLDLVPEQTEDERGVTWGEPARTPDADLQRYREEKPPHHSG